MGAFSAGSQWLQSRTQKPFPVVQTKEAEGSVSQYKLFPALGAQEHIPSPSFPRFFAHSPMLGPREGPGEVRCCGAVAAGA